MPRWRRRRRLRQQRKLGLTASGRVAVSGSLPAGEEPRVDRSVTKVIRP